MVAVKVHETFDFPKIESVTILCFYLKVSKKTVVLIRICYQAIFLRGKSADAFQTKREEGAADRRLNQNLPRLRWSRRESMQFYKTFRMRSIDKNKNIKTTTKNIFFCSIMTTVREGQNGWASLPVIKMKFIFVNKTSSFLIVFKFRKSYIQF